MTGRDWSPRPQFSDEYVRTCHLRWPADKVYGVGKELMCDFHIGGKPDAVCVEVLEPGSGRSSKGKLRVRIIRDYRAYRKGEILEISAYAAVPKGHTFVREYYVRVRTNYFWTNEDPNLSRQATGQGV